MVRLTPSCALLALSALPAVAAGPLAFFHTTSQAVVRAGLRSVFRFNETQIDRFLAAGDAPLEPHPYAFDLTDANYETILATGTEDNPFAPPLSEEDVWVITVHGPDPISKVFLKRMDEVAAHNSSQAGGSLAPNVHFARLSYARETILPTRLTPVIVIGTNRMRTLRFLRPGNVRPDAETLSEVLSKPDVWKQVEPWTGALAPGGRFEDRLHRLAKIWAKVHRESAKVPKFVLLALSGFIMNFVISWFHKDDGAKQARFQAQVDKAREELAAKAVVDEAAAAPVPTSAATPTTGNPAKKRASRRT